MTDQPTDAATIYDAFAEKYRAYSEAKSTYIRAVDDLVVDTLGNAPKLLLDYGAGDGVRGAAVAERLGPFRFVQTDISPEMVARCQALGKADDVLLVRAPDWTSALPPVDAAICLWNVLGHVSDTDHRRALLRQLRRLIAPSGTLCIDVNNRHYVGYGRWRSLGRRVIDAIKPDYSRGDIRFTWTIDGVDYPASGHFFTPAEMRDLLTTAGFEIVRAKSVDYQSGAVSDDLTKGQLFFVARASA